ncbi:MAG: translocation/assembly module TamB domain-containing protein [Hydrogenophaga sp.]
MTDRATPPAAPPATPRRPRLRPLRWLATALLVLAVAAPLALWWWAASPSSLATTLSWAQRYLNSQPGGAGSLVVEGAVGSLRHGGQVALLRWTQEGLTVQADDVRLQWHDALWFTLLAQRRLAPDAVHLGRLSIVDERAPTEDASEPPAGAELPLRLDLPWSIDALSVRGGTAIELAGLRGHYAYGPAPAGLGTPQAHQLRLDTLRWAEGSYQGHLVLGAQSPMPVQLQARGQVRVPVPEGTPQDLDATLDAQGTLAHASATLDARLQLRQASATGGDAPAALDARARLQPWNTQQPLAGLQAQLQQLNLAGLWPGAPHTALSGQATADSSPNGHWQARLALDNARPAPADQQGLPFSHLQLAAQQQGAQWTLSELQARIGDGVLRGQASLDAGAGPLWQGPWSGRLQIERIDPARLWSLLAPGRLDGTLDAQTHTTEGGHAFTTTFTGQLALSPLAGRRGGGPTLLDALDLRGRWQARASAPAQGQLTLEHLRVRGAGVALQGQARLNLANHHLDGQLEASAPGLTARWQGLAAPASGQGELALRLNDATAAQQWITALQAQPVIGPLVRDHLGPVLDARLQGQASAIARWQGGLAPLGMPAPAGTPAAAQALTLDLDLQVPELTLQTSATAPAWQLRDARLHVAGPPTAPTAQLTLQGQTARLVWEQLRWDAGALATRGTLHDLPLAWVDLFTSPGVLTQAGIQSDLLLQGHWDVQLPAGAQAQPRVQLRLERQAGDLSVRTAALPAPVAAGVRTARLDVSTGRNAGAVQARLQWDTRELGQIDAQAQTALAPPSASQPAWHWPEQAPLTGQLRARLPELGVWSALAPPGWRVQGSLEAQAELSGTRAEPQWRGTLNAEQLAVSSVVEGIAFTGGHLRARLDGDRLQLEQLRLHGPGGASEGGVFEATGSAAWRPVTREGRTRREPLIELQATARQLRVSNRPDRRLTLSGQVQARLDGPALDVRGALTADNALFILPDEFTPRLGADVVVRLHGEPPVPPGAAPVQTNVEVQIDLGPQFEVRGQGLATHLRGRLTVRSTPALPSLRVVGEVRTQRGTYRAYGQQLAIESGVLRFAGPYDDPALDIIAIRPNLRDQRVGVQILGTAQRPQVKLFSDPDLPDSEKLAWLVLGRPATGAGAEAAVLQQAALALLAGDGEGVGSRLAGFLGLDQLDIVDRGESGDALSLGKRLSNRLYVNYERGLLSTLGTVAVFYDLSRWLTLRARAGEENAIDVIFVREFD